MFLKDLINAKDAVNRAWRESNEFVEYTDEQLREKQLEILDVFKDLQKACVDNDILVSLCEGSALGAVRHGGFIPWDDDLDVTIPRRDFEKFKTIFNDVMGDKYILNSPNFSVDPISRFAKILRKSDGFDGVSGTDIFVDIFILDNIPDSSKIRKVKAAWCNGLMFIAACVKQYEIKGVNVPALYRQSKAYKVRSIIGRIFSIFSGTTWYNWVDKAVQTRHETEYCGIATARKHYNGEYFKKDIVFPFKKTVFEGVECFVYNDVHTYLNCLYGADYMTPPPIEKREKHYHKK